MPPKRKTAAIPVEKLAPPPPPEPVKEEAPPPMPPKRKTAAIPIEKLAPPPPPPETVKEEPEEEIKILDEPAKAKDSPPKKEAVKPPAKPGPKPSPAAVPKPAPKAPAKPAPKQDPAVPRTADDILRMLDDEEPKPEVEKKAPAEPEAAEFKPILVKVTCPNPACGKTTSVKGAFAGKKGKCPSCGGAVEIPRKAVLCAKCGKKTPVQNAVLVASKPMCMDCAMK
ncbi:MAG: hypothetical protein MUC63_09645 [Planctomycetes bacterium]|jgi:hypothetical protein|nr:hypothetical protein [Planctomycetota bacterium]